MNKKKLETERENESILQTRRTRFSEGLFVSPISSYPTTGVRLSCPSKERSLSHSVSNSSVFLLFYQGCCLNAHVFSLVKTREVVLSYTLKIVKVWYPKGLVVFLDLGFPRKILVYSVFVF